MINHTRSLFILTVGLFVGFARAEGDGYRPVAIKSRVSQGTAISCAHFRGRLKSQMQTADQAFWYADPRVALSELNAYFAHRMAANPYDMSATAVADVTWSIPISDYPVGGEVLQIAELARDDFEGGQAEFAVANRSVKVKESTVEVRTPVRMVDVCVNGYIDLKVLSECPVDEVDFWRPDGPAKHFGTVMVTECGKAQTVRLSLAGVDEVMNAKKIELGRGAPPLGVPVSTTPACDGEDAKAANWLENLRGIKRLHNCEIDVVRRDKLGQVEYSLFARDNYACQSSLYACFETEVSLSVPANCLNHPNGVSPTVRFSSGVSFSGGNFTAQLAAQLNRYGQVMSLSASHVNRQNGNFADRVTCVPDIQRRN